MIKKMFLLFTLVIFLVSCIRTTTFTTLATQSLGNTYYVATSGNDGNPGTQSQPWKTIQKAANTMIAGDTVIIQNGIYRESVDLTGSTGVEGQSGNETQGYISYIGISRDGVILDGAGLSWGSGFMSGVIGKGKRVVNYIRISNMTIQNFLADGVEFYANKDDGTYPRIASHNITIDNLKVHDNTMGGIMFCGGEDPNSGYSFIVRNSEVYNNHGTHHGIKFSGDPRVISTGDHIHDSIIENNLVYNNDQIGIHNSSGNYNITITGNVVHDNGWQGIAGSLTWDSIYSNNVVYANGKLDITSGDGIVLWSSQNITVTGNKIYNNPGYGIEIPSALTDGKPIITNNIVYNNKGGIQVSYPANGATILNNTLAFNTQAGLFFYSNTLGNIVKNNILYQNANQLWSQDGRNIYDYNLYYPNISFLDKGIHDISADPLFVNPTGGDFHLQTNSPAINAGTVVLITNDYDRNVRPQGTRFDIGAYEFVIAVTSIATLTNTFLPTITNTFTFTPTSTFIPTSTFTDTPTFTPSYTVTCTPTFTSTFTPTFTPTRTSTPTFTFTFTPTFTFTFTPTKTKTPTPTPTKTPTPTRTPECYIVTFVDGTNITVCKR